MDQISLRKSRNIAIQSIDSSTGTTSTSASTGNQTITQASQRSSQKQENWDIFVKSYLQLAKTGLESIKKNDGQSKIIIISIIYNIKHALEISVKYFRRTFDEDFDEKEKFKKDQWHEISYLFTGWKSKLKSKGNVDKELEELLDIFQNSIEKYNKLDLLKEFITSSIEIYDGQNTFFRYPENKGLEVNFGKVIEGIPDEFVSTIKQDIDVLLDTLDKIKKRLN